jgi:hypothetical protein
MATEIRGNVYVGREESGKETRQNYEREKVEREWEKTATTLLSDDDGPSIGGVEVKIVEADLVAASTKMRSSGSSNQ